MWCKPRSTKIGDYLGSRENVSAAELDGRFEEEMGAATWAGKREPRRVEDESRIVRPARRFDAGTPAKVFDLGSEKCVGDLPAGELGR